jgi:hypothetical protein
MGVPMTGARKAVEQHLRGLTPTPPWF